MALFGAMTINTRRRPTAPFSVTVDIVGPEQASAYPHSYDVTVPDGAAVRAVPLLSILNSGEQRLIVVGDIRVTVHRDLRTTLTVVVRGLWLTDAGDSPAGPTATNWRMEMTDDRLTDLLGTAIRAVPYGSHADPEGLATEIAKAHAERSRDGIRALRSFRYCMEHLVGSSLRGSTHKLEGILADVVELSTLIGRVADEAREAARGGMGAWITNPAAYHAQRRLQDPALPSRPGGRRAKRAAWFPILDAGVRQCRAMETEACAEAPLLHSLLNAASTIAVTREAQAQETFNMVAAVGGVMFGVPALILALYDASDILPLHVGNAVVLVPLVIGGLIAAMIAAVLPGRRKTGKARRFAVAMAAVLVMLAILASAGTLVTPGS
ncbi:hypothetical protein Ait01nite_013030 [Actinoplanes italicus]|uniref:Uncharacterized protein n=1 Tax=Actinoplanes italicus TaxID=113567 RepID=A0A2T0KH17_9ACTN|nr:hypothetical protein [Actinoplanes italicus]PRX22735.1 hypothetical protein CLV67_104263 [Actinoplanes italicus]GIE28258.1 hypothetical protein Ait01nite_013030 [Actinoplanes italicus]